MGFDVKITTKNHLFDLLCPHSCVICGKLGDYLCDCCKKDILFNHENYCPKCKHLTGECKCSVKFLMPPIFTIGWRDEIIGKIAQDYKYNSVKAAGAVLADILSETLPFFSEKITVVPLPTIDKHIRERGFDHTLYLAKQLAKRRDWEIEQVLGRAKDTVQVGANEQARITQAYAAYCLKYPINKNKTYLLLDDIWTTGMSMKAATKMLQRAGASKIAISVLAVSRKH